jgi:NADH-quinone oxidoreductase subunit A
MLQEYFPILIFLGVATGLGVLLLVLGFLIGQGQKDEEKLSPYECGFEAFDDSRMKFDVRYYLVAILFIIFDLEIAFLFPWAVSLDAVGKFGLLSMARPRKRPTAQKLPVKACSKKASSLRVSIAL